MQMSVRPYRKAMKAVKQNSPIEKTNTDIMMTALNFWINSNTSNSNVPPEHTDIVTLKMVKTYFYRLLYNINPH